MNNNSKNSEQEYLFEYKEPLLSGKVIKRYKRFFVDVERSDGSIETVHCANSGSMKSCFYTGQTCFTLDSHNAERKLRHTLELIELDDGYACLNTLRANQCVKRFLELCVQKKIKGPEIFSSFDVLTAEAKYGSGTRFDFCLSNVNQIKKNWIEVKSVSLKTDQNTLSFPDAVTERGQKHLNELMCAVRAGDAACLIFAIMRSSKMSEDVIHKNFRVCREIDPEYADLYEKAINAGVSVLLFIVNMDTSSMSLRSLRVIN